MSAKKGSAAAANDEGIAATAALIEASEEKILARLAEVEETLRGLIASGQTETGVAYNQLLQIIQTTGATKSTRAKASTAADKAPETAASFWRTIYLEDAGRREALAENEFVAEWMATVKVTDLAEITEANLKKLSVALWNHMQKSPLNGVDLAGEAVELTRAKVTEMAKEYYDSQKTDAAGDTADAEAETAEEAKPAAPKGAKAKGGKATPAPAKAKGGKAAPAKAKPAVEEEEAEEEAEEEEEPAPKAKVTKPAPAKPATAKAGAAKTITAAKATPAKPAAAKGKGK